MNKINQAVSALSPQDHARLNAIIVEVLQALPDCSYCCTPLIAR